MKNFEPGGLRNRKPDLGGRPFSDAGKYAPKKRFEGGKQSFGNKSFGNDRDKKDMTLYSATCTTCGKSCEVPFRPDGKKPVLCRDCFANKNASPTNGAGSNRDRFTPNEMIGRNAERPFTPKPAAPSISVAQFDALVTQVSSLEIKVNRILEILQNDAGIVAAIPPELGDVPPSEVLAAPTKLRKPKKVTPAIKKAAAKKKVAKKAAVAKKSAKKAK